MTGDSGRRSDSYIKRPPSGRLSILLGGQTRITSQHHLPGTCNGGPSSYLTSLIARAASRHTLHRSPVPPATPRAFSQSGQAIPELHELHSQTTLSARHRRIVSRDSLSLAFWN